MRAYAPVLALVLLFIGGTLSSAQTPTPPPKFDPTMPPSDIGGKTLSQWVKDLRHTDPSIRLEAIRAVQLFGVDSREAVTNLCYLLANDRDVSVRTNVCIALMTVEVRDGDIGDVVKELSKRIETDQQAVVRFQAALAIGRFEEKGKDAIPHLIHSSKDPASFEIRKVAVNSLARAGYDPKMGADPRATVALVAALKDNSADVRLEAVMSLGAMGDPVPMHKPAVLTALRSMLNDRDKAVIVWAHASLMLLEKFNEKEMALLAKYLHADDSRTKIHAVRAFGVMGKEAKPRMGEIVDLLKDKDNNVLIATAIALGEIGKKADPGPAAMTGLTELLKKKDIDYHLKVAVEEAIDKIKGKDKEKPK